MKSSPFFRWVLFLSCFLVWAGRAELANPLVKSGSAWRYLNTGENPGTDWTHFDFNDGAWLLGPAQLGYGDGDEATVIQGVKAPHPITAYFRHIFEVTSPTSFSQVVLRLLRDDGAVVYLNGKELLRSNMPDGPITPETPAVHAIGNDAERVFHTFEFPSTVLLPGKNIIAVEVHQVSPESTDVSFDLVLAGINSTQPGDRPSVSIRAEPDQTSEPLPNAIVLPGRFIVTRTGSTEQPLYVYLRYGGTAVWGTDFETKPSEELAKVPEILEEVVKIPAGRIAASVHVFGKTDNLREETETIIAYVAHGNSDDPASQYVVDPNHSSATVRLLDADGGLPELPIVSIVASAPDTSEPSPTTRIAPGKFTLKRSGGDLSRALTVFLTYDGSATPEHDYTRLDQFVTFPEGMPEKELLVVPLDDNIAEADESVIAKLSEPPFDRAPDYRIAADHAVARVIIHDTDTPTGAKIEITNPHDGEAFHFGTTIHIQATAVDPAGYIPRVEFWDGEKMIGVSEVVFVQAPPPGTPIFHEFEWKGASVGEHLLTARGVDTQGNKVVSLPVRIRVVEDGGGGGETIVRISPMDVEATEFPLFVDAINPASFLISRTGDLTRDVMVFFSTHGTAEPEKDYRKIGTSAMIPSGKESIALEIVPTSDEVAEKMETVSLRLEPSPLAGPLPTYAIDPHARIGAAVIYDRQPPQEGQIEIAFPGGGDHFSAGESIPMIAAAYHPSVTLTRAEFFANGQKIGSSEVIPEKVEQGGLIFHSMTWEHVTGGVYTLLSKASLPNAEPLVSSEIAIKVGDAAELPLVSVRFLESQTDEPWPDADFAPGSLEFKRTGPLTEGLVVFYEAGGTATPGYDYKRLSNSVYFDPGKDAVYVKVEAIDDKFPEGEETVVVELTSPPPHVDLAFPSYYRIDPEHRVATVKILDNDIASEAATIEITSPVKGQVLAYGTPIVIRATAVDKGGEIDRLQFYDGAKLIGESGVRLPPNIVPGEPVVHEFVWQGAEMGRHVLRALGVGSDNRYVISAPVEISVVRETTPVVLEIEAVDPMATEGGANGAVDPAVFIIKRVGGPVDVAVPVYYKLEGTAHNGVDYSELKGTTHIPSGAKAIEIIIKPFPDHLPEGEESVEITLQPSVCPAIFPPPPWCYEIGESKAARAVIIDHGGTGNHPPFVVVARPADGSVFAKGQTIEIVAEASDPDGAIAKLEILVDGEVLGAAEQDRLEINWFDASVGPHILLAWATDNAGTVGYSKPVRLLVKDLDMVAFVRRELPAAYSPGKTFEVMLRATPPLGTSAYAVEDLPPAGWQVSAISHEGVFDPAVGKVKFGPFTDSEPRILSYQLTPPQTAVGRHEFAGSSSANGRAFPIAGDRLIDFVDARHPADENADSSIDLLEVTGYAAAWKEGRPWPAGPAPIPMPYVTRAGMLWQKGEKYIFDPAKGPPPLCWISANSANGTTVQAFNVPSAVRTLSGIPLPGEALTVTITVSPPAGTASYALEEKIPAEWTVAHVSHEGRYDAAARMIRWGVFFDGSERAVTYTVTPPSEKASFGVLSGVVSFDGNLQAILGGERVVSADLSTGMKLEKCERDEKGSVRLTLSGPAGQQYVLEASNDLVHWIEVGSAYLPDGQMEFEDANAAATPHRYYRLRVE